MSLIEYHFCFRASHLFRQEPQKARCSERLLHVRILQKLRGLIDSLLFVLQLTAEFKEKRRLVDELKDDLQSKIADYSQMAESGRILNGTIVSQSNYDGTRMNYNIVRTNSREIPRI